MSRVAYLRRAQQLRGLKGSQHNPLGDISNRNHSDVQASEHPRLRKPLSQRSGILKKSTSIAENSVSSLENVNPNLQLRLRARRRQSRKRKSGEAFRKMEMDQEDSGDVPEKKLRNRTIKLHNPLQSRNPNTLQQQQNHLKSLKSVKPLKPLAHSSSSSVSQSSLPSTSLSTYTSAAGLTESLQAFHSAIVNSSQSQESKDTAKSVGSHIHRPIPGFDSSSTAVLRPEASPKRPSSPLDSEIDLFARSLDFSLDPPAGPIPPCDLDGKDDDLCAPQYVYGVMDYLRQLELKYLPDADYFTRQDDINNRMRTILVDWLVEVHDKFDLRPQTLYLTVNYLDRFLSLQKIGRNKLQLVGTTALLLASKFEEVYPPQIRDLVYVSDRACVRQDIIDMEQRMISALEFNLSVATSLRFCERFLRVAGVGPHRPKGARTREQRNTLTHFYANYIMELCMCEADFLRFKPSEIAASAVYLALRITRVPFRWDQLLRNHTNYTVAELSDCTQEMQRVLLNPNPKERSIRKKYARKKHGEVALVPLRSRSSGS